MTVQNALKDLNTYFDAHKLYFSFLEVMIIIGICYVAGIIDLIDAPWITYHISNLIGTIILMLLFIGPTTFQSPRSNLRRIFLATVIILAVNLALEFLQPIGDLRLARFHFADFNTPDIFDALYGAIGVMIVYVSLFFARKKSEG